MDPEKKSQFDDPEYRKSVEDKLEPFKIDTLFEKGRLEQEVKLSKSISVVFTTLEAGADALLDKIAWEETQNGGIFGKVYMILQLAAAIRTFRSVPLVKNPVEYSGDNDEKYIEHIKEKVRVIKNFDTHIVSLLTTHLVWFDERVNKFIKEHFVKELENF